MAKYWPVSVLFIYTSPTLSALSCSWTGIKITRAKVNKHYAFADRTRQPGQLAMENSAHSFCRALRDEPQINQNIEIQSLFLCLPNKVVHWDYVLGKGETLAGSPTRPPCWLQNDPACTFTVPRSFLSVTCGKIITGGNGIHSLRLPHPCSLGVP